MQLKTRQGPGVPVATGISSGIAEAWVKWTLPLAAPVDFGPRPGSEGSWVLVEKQRWIRMYRVVGDAVGSVQPDRKVATGCNVELVTIEVDEESWWGLGVESFGAQSSLFASASATAKVLLHELHSRVFDEGSSFGYPHWLRVVRST